MGTWNRSSVPSDAAEELGAVSNFERPAGPDQLIVMYVTPDTGAQVDPAVIYAAVAEDAAARASAGWRIVSTDSISFRQMGTAGNILFQSGGQFSTQAAAAVVFERR